MNRTRVTDRLVASVMLLAASLVLLAGLTFAWFTDTVTNTGNVIETGTLQVKLQKDAVDDGGAVAWADVTETEPVFNDLTFEPGKSVAVNLQAVNIGDLAAKYELRFANVSATQDIDKVLEVSVGGTSLGTLSDMVANNTAIAQGRVGAKDRADAAAEIGQLVISMPESAGNSYQGAEVTFDLAFVATQAAAEKDGYGNDQYDAAATVPVTDVVGLRNAIAASGIFALGSDLTLEAADGADRAEPFAVDNADVTIDFAGKTVANIDDVWTDKANWSIFSARAGSNLTLQGNGTVHAKANDCYAVDVCDGGKLTIKDGTYVGNLSAIYVEEGELIIEGGTFSIQQLKPGTGEERYRETLNCYDKNYQNGTAKITVKGGTFMNFNPAASTAEPGGANFVAEGYKVVSEVRDGATWYTVVPE